MKEDKLIVVQKLCQIINTEYDFGVISKPEWIKLTKAVKIILNYKGGVK